jgi:mRNA interferase MazF
MMFERGDLLLVPFPFTDLSAAKRRPVLAVARMERSAIREPT